MFGSYYEGIITNISACQFLISAAPQNWITTQSSGNVNMHHQKTVRDERSRFDLSFLAPHLEPGRVEGWRNKHHLL